MSSKKYITPTIPEDFIPCDWNEGDNLIDTNSLLVDKYIRDDTEELLLNMSREILDIPKNNIIKLTGGSDTAILHVLSFASSLGYKEFRMRDNDYAQVKAFAGTTNMDVEIVPNEKIFNDIKSHSVIYFSNPCNPTGEIIEADLIYKVCESNPTCLFLLDNAYIEFHPSYDFKSMLQIENLINFRTFSKYWGFSGARLGAIIFNDKNKLSKSLSVLNSKHISILHKHVIENIYRNKNLYIEKRKKEDQILREIAKRISKIFDTDYEIAGNFARFDCASYNVKQELVSFFNEKKIAIRDLGHLPNYKFTVRFSYREKAAEALGAINP